MFYHGIDYFNITFGIPEKFLLNLFSNLKGDEVMWMSRGKDSLGEKEYQLMCI